VPDSITGLYLLAGLHMALRGGNTRESVPRGRMARRRSTDPGEPSNGPAVKRQLIGMTPLGAPSTSSAPQKLFEEGDSAGISALGQPEHGLPSEHGIAMGAGDLQQGGHPFVVLQL
jgi:hypothetical protein